MSSFWVWQYRQLLLNELSLGCSRFFCRSLVLISCSWIATIYPSTCDGMFVFNHPCVSSWWMSGLFCCLRSMKPCCGLLLWVFAWPFFIFFLTSLVTVFGSPVVLVISKALHNSAELRINLCCSCLLTSLIKGFVGARVSICLANDIMRARNISNTLLSPRPPWSLGVQSRSTLFFVCVCVCVCVCMCVCVYIYIYEWV